MHGIGGCPCRKRGPRPWEMVWESWTWNAKYEEDPSMRCKRRVAQIKAQMSLLSLKKRAKPTKDSPKRKRAQGVVYKYIKFKYILILYNIIQSNFSNIS